MGLWSTVGGVAGNIILPGIGGPIGAGIGNYADHKINGVPTPTDAKPGAEAGAGYRDFMDEAFPNTTPWERLGASTGGTPAADIAADNAKKMQKAEFKQQLTLADMKNRADIIAASTPLGAIAREDNLMSYMTGGISATGKNTYSTPTSIAETELPSKIAHNKQSARKAASETAANRSTQPFKKPQAKAELDYTNARTATESVKPWTDALGTAAGAFGGVGLGGMALYNVLKGRTRTPGKYLRISEKNPYGK